MDRETHRIVQYLITHDSASDMDVYMLGIHNISSTIREALKYGYKIEKKHMGALWNRSTVYYMKKQK